MREMATEFTDEQGNPVEVDNHPVRAQRNAMFYWYRRARYCARLQHTSTVYQVFRLPYRRFKRWIGIRPARIQGERVK